MRLQSTAAHRVAVWPRPYTVLLVALLLTITLSVACGSDNGESGATSSPATPTTDVSGICSNPIPALTSEPVTKERLQSAISKMREVKSAADAGDQATAIFAFSGDTHAVTHDIDSLLREKDRLLAQDLCASIVLIEEEFGGTRDLQAVAPAAEIAAGLLEESGRQLGLSD